MDTISIYSNIILERRPLLKTILQQFGDFSIWDATNELLTKGKKNKNLYNPDFIQLVKIAFPYLDKDYLKKLDICLRENPLVSTADHQCPINHPVYINSNIQLSLFTKSFSLNKKPYIMPPILSFSSLPLNNTAYIRGLLMASPKGEKRFSLFTKSFSLNKKPYIMPPILSFSSLPLNNTAYIRGLLMASPKGEKRFSFFGSSMRHAALPLVKAFCFDKKTIKSWLKANQNIFSNHELDFISLLLKKVSTDSSINKCTSYSEQISVWNKWLWSNFFPDYRMEFFPIDILSQTFFSHYLLNDQQLPLYKFLFEWSTDKIIELFNGIYGCWNIENSKGTFFFWGIDE